MKTAIAHIDYSDKMITPIYAVNYMINGI